MKKTNASLVMSGISRNVLILGLASLFTDLSSQMVFPLIPLFLTSVLGAGGRSVGIVEGAAEATASLLKVVSGYFSDKAKKRKPFVIFGYSLSSLTKPLFALAGTWGFVVAVRVVERIGKGLRTAPRDALVAESSEYAHRGKAYGFHRAMDGVGSIAGTLMAFFLLPVVGYRNVFLYAFFPGVLAVGILCFVKEKRPPEQPKISGELPRLHFRLLPRNLRLFIITAAVFSMGHFGYAFLLLRAQGVGFSDTAALLLYAVFYVVYTLVAIPSGIISDKFGRKPVLLAGYLMFALISLGLVYIPSRTGVLLFFALYGIFYAMIDGAQRAYVVDLAPPQIKATALGIFHTAIGLVALPGGFIAGFLWDTLAPEATFLYGFSLSIIAVFLFLRIWGRPEAANT